MLSKMIPLPRELEVEKYGWRELDVERERERESDLGEEVEEMREKRNVAVVEKNHESKSQCSNDGRREKNGKRKSISERHWQLFFLMRYEKNGSCCLR